MQQTGRDDRSRRHGACHRRHRPVDGEPYTRTFGRDSKSTTTRITRPSWSPSAWEGAQTICATAHLPAVVEAAPNWRAERPDFYLT